MIFSKVKTWPVIRLLFDGFVDNRVKEPTGAAQIEKDRQLERLKKWLENLPEKIEKDAMKRLANIVRLDAEQHGPRAATRLTKALKELGHYESIFQNVARQLPKVCGVEYGIDNSCSYSINVDTSQFSKEDLASLTDEFNALHDMAAGYNIGIEFAGFDRLPRKAVAVKNASRWGDDSVMIGFYFADRYDTFKNPEYNGKNDDEIRSRVNARLLSGSI